MNGNAELSNEIFNFPNKVSAVRLVLSFLVFVLIPLEQYAAALVVFVIAAGTDWLDGWYARKYNQVTQLGRILDPFCDKILICGTFILLAVAMQQFAWYVAITGLLAVIVVGREILVTALRSFIEQSGGDFSASWAGKLKMWFQCIAAGACLLALAQVGSEGTEQELSPAVFWAIVIFVWLALLTTLYSGAGYVAVVAKKLTGSPSP